jgi:hypothetical protein
MAAIRQHRYIWPVERFTTPDITEFDHEERFPAIHEVLATLRARHGWLLETHEDAFAFISFFCRRFITALKRQKAPLLLDEWREINWFAKSGLSYDVMDDAGRPRPIVLPSLFHATVNGIRIRDAEAADDFSFQIARLVRIIHATHR